MDTTRLSSKGQIVIPKHIRQARRWEPGTEFVIEEAVDTHVLVRYVTNDDPAQAARAFELLKHSRDVFVPKTVVLETEWVLRAVYGLPRENVRNALLHVLGLPNVVVEDAERVAEAIDLYDGGMDLADALHLSSSSDADEFFTFDRRFERLARGLERPVRLL